MNYFLKIGCNKNVSNFVVYIIKFISFNSRDTVLYPGLSLGTLVLVIHLNRQADTGIHKVFNSIILKEMLKLNVGGVDTLTLKI